MIPTLFAFTFEGLSAGLAPSSCCLFAYLDPGTGSFALQLLIAGLCSGLYAVKHYWQQIRIAVRRSPRHEG
jgi:hypothetical protein